MALSTKRYLNSLARLDDFSNYEKNSHSLKPLFSLRGIRELAARLGNPQNAFPAVHVAGTVGKGSVCELISDTLIAAGYNVGLYTSPHLLDIRERIRVNGEMAARNELGAGIEELLAKVKHNETGDFTYFEALTAVAMLIFQKRKIDIAVVETGLGGRLDATRIAKPVLCVITRIGLDHTHVLGGTLGEIAAEKAGIIPRGGILVAAPQRPAAMKTLRRCCREKGATLIPAEKIIVEKVKYRASGADISVSESAGGAPLRLSLGLPGAFQVENARTAFAALRALSEQGYEIPNPAVKSGFAAARVAGRMDTFTLSSGALLVVDGGHNPPAAAALSDALTFHRRSKKLLLIGMMRDKDLRETVRILAPGANEIVPIALPGDRAFSAPEIADAARPLAPVRHLAGGVTDALDYATARATKNTLILLTGSLYAVGEGLEWAGRNAKPVR